MAKMKPTKESKDTPFDKKMDKKKGIKEGSKRDMAIDARGGFKPKGKKK